MTVRRVVLVVVEGLEARAIERFSLFNLNRLVDRGASALNTPSEMSGVPAARLASLLTGVSPRRHGATSGGWAFGRTLSRLEPLPSSIASEGFQATAFLSGMAADQASRIGFIARDIGFQQITCKGANCSEVVSSALNALCTQRRGLIAIRLSDLSGLSFDSQEYADAAVKVDQALGILASLSGASSGESLLIVLSDQNQSEVSRPPEETWTDRNLSLILFGRCVRSGALNRVSLLDVPSTILWALGIAVPRHYEGRALVEAFAVNPTGADVRHSA